MARLIFLSWVAIAAVVFLAAPHNARACGGGGSTSSGSAANMASAARSSSAAAAMSAARAMMLSRSAMVRPFGRINYGMSPGYMGSGFGNSGTDSSSSPRMASRVRSAVQSQPSLASTPKAAQAVDPAGEASNLDLPTRDWVVNGETGDTIITAQYAGVIDANVTLRKTDGHIVLAPVELSTPARRASEEVAEFVRIPSSCVHGILTNSATNVCAAVYCRRVGSRSSSHFAAVLAFFNKAVVRIS
jgi:hypothetical protein